MKNTHNVMSPVEIIIIIRIIMSLSAGSCQRLQYNSMIGIILRTLSGELVLLALLQQN